MWRCRLRPPGWRRWNSRTWKLVAEHPWSCSTWTTLTVSKESNMMLLLMEMFEQQWPEHHGMSWCLIVSFSRTTSRGRRSRGPHSHNISFIQEHHSERILTWPICGFCSRQESAWTWRLCPSCFSPDASWWRLPSWSGSRHPRAAGGPCPSPSGYAGSCCRWWTSPRNIWY